MPLTRILGVGLGLGLVSTRVQPSFDALGRGTTYEDGGELGGLLDADVGIDFAFAFAFALLALCSGGKALCGAQGCK